MTAPLAIRAAAIVIFVATYAVVAFGRAPGLRLDRTGAALAGGALMVACGALSLGQAERAISLDTLILLLGMMILVANLRLSGFFDVVVAWSVRRARHPLLLLGAVVVVSGVLSAFLVNDAICLVLTPLVLDVALRLERDPVPYLVAVAMASNVGSTATITGNPQNMIVGTVSGIPYGAFAASLAPVAGVGLLIVAGVVALVWRREFRTGFRIVGDAAPRVRMDRPRLVLLLKSLAATAGLVAAFFLGAPPPAAAIVAGAALLPTRIVHPRKVYAEIDGGLLLMFAGLFVVVAGLEHTVLTPDVVARVAALQLGRTGVLAGVTAGLSNLVSNVPAVLVLRPFVERLHDVRHAWLVVAMAATLAGNLTLLGSVANLIVVQRARAAGVTVGFWPYLRAGIPVTVLTLAAGVLILG